MRKKLGLVHKQNVLDGLHLDDYLILHEHIQSISTLQLNLMVSQRHRFLLFNLEAASTELEGEAGFIGRFQESGTQ
jgi:hypothetical protein